MANSYITSGVGRTMPDLEWLYHVAISTKGGLEGISLFFSSAHYGVHGGRMVCWSC
jgi:hypothetical protein